MSEQEQTKFSKFGQTFISYGSYHNNIVNKWIHIICVPLLAATLICGLSYIPYSINVKGYTIGAAELTVAISLVYNMSLNFGFGLGMGVVMFVTHFAWQKFFQYIPQENALSWVVGIHIVAWVFQIIGHQVFEKRKPALLDNLVQILNAPLFVVVEICEMIGLKSSEMEAWNEQIRKNIAALRAKDKAK